MELLHALGAAIALFLLYQGVMWLRESRRRLRLKLEKVPPGSDADDNRHPELGKVRVRTRADGRPEPVIEKPLVEKPTVVEGRPAPVVVEPPLLVSEPAHAEADEVPLLQAESDAPFLRPDALVAEPLAPVFQHDDEPVSPALSSVASVQELQQEPEPVFENAAPAVQQETDEAVPVLLTPAAATQTAYDAVEQHDMFADEPIMLPPSRKPPEPVRSRASVLYEKPVEPVRPVAMPAEEEKPHVDVQDVIALHVVARIHLFNGEDLLRSILAYGLRFGEMSIFHRHEQPTGQGRILFSMAKAVEPGTFDLEAMTGEDIPGVSFFLSLPGINSIHAYDIMVDTVKRLATDLNGEILDGQQQVLTRQLIEHYRERVQEFERRRLMKRPAGH